MRLLDLFCGAGGCAVGYAQAGFTDIVGVDHVPQPRYPFPFVQADWQSYLNAHGTEFDVIHASSPCQAYSEATPGASRGAHPDLIEPVRAALRDSAKPYVIENVEGARTRLDNPIKLCGTMFGLPIWRHRYFEVHPLPFALLPPCRHLRYPITVPSGSHTRHTMVPVLCSGGGDGRRAWRTLHRPREAVTTIRWAMQIPWMTQQELTQAIPPVYTEWIGRELIRALA